jgi:hypothetical protein
MMDSPHFNKKKPVTTPQLMRCSIEFFGRLHVNPRRHLIQIKIYPTSTNITTLLAWFIGAWSHFVEPLSLESGPDPRDAETVSGWRATLSIGNSASRAGHHRDTALGMLAPDEKKGCAARTPNPNREPSGNGAKPSP